MRYIIGIDEVGRGSLAGPVVVAALLMPKNLRIRSGKLPKLRDSKHLTAIQRGKFYSYLKNHSKISHITAKVFPKTIDKINISQAANRAATKALKKLIFNSQFPISKSRIYLDGGLYLQKSSNPNPYTLNPKTLIKGDLKINAIKLASIVAKVTRDKYMVKLHKKYPQYGFNKHKGYGTKKHMRAIKKHGPSEVHRLTFVP